MVTAEDAIALKDKVKLSTKAGFLSNSYPTGLEVGETKVFPMAITNTFAEDEKFMVALEFNEARDSRTNLIETDEVYVMDWLSLNEFEDYVLEQYQQAFVPVGVTVGEDIAPGKPTEPGTYYFTAVITYEMTQYTNKEYVELDFSFKVK